MSRVATQITPTQHTGRGEASPEAMHQDTQYSVQRWVLQGTFDHPWASYHVPWVFLNSKLTLTRKARSTTHIQIRAHHTTCVNAAHTHFSTQQSHQDTLVPFASLSAISGTFNSLSKVLFIFPSWYLFAIGLEPIFSFGWNLPPALRSNPEERDS